MDWPDDAQVSALAWAWAVVRGGPQRELARAAAPGLAACSPQGAANVLWAWGACALHVPVRPGFLGVL